MSRPREGDGNQRTKINPQKGNKNVESAIGPIRPCGATEQLRMADKDANVEDILLCSAQGSLASRLTLVPLRVPIFFERASWHDDARLLQVHIPPASSVDILLHGPSRIYAHIYATRRINCTAEDTVAPNAVIRVL